MPPLRDKELHSYTGILFVRDDAVRAMASVGSDERMAGVEVINGGTLEVSWRNGDRSQIRWADLRDKGGLGEELPPPRLAFSSEGEIGLLIASETPRPGLIFREPHSVVHSIGVLTAKGLRRD